MTIRIGDPLVIVECAPNDAEIRVDGSPVPVEDDDGPLRRAIDESGPGTYRVEVICDDELVDLIDLQVITTNSGTPAAGSTAIVMLFLFMMMVLLVAGPQSLTGSSRQ